MAQSVKKKYSLNIQGVVDVDDGRIIISVEDRGEFDLAALMEDFSGRECKIAVNYDEEYVPEVDEETGEVV